MHICAITCVSVVQLFSAGEPLLSSCPEVLLGPHHFASAVTFVARVFLGQV
jgi:hypothetical protein